MLHPPPILEYCLKKLHYLYIQESFIFIPPKLSIIILFPFKLFLKNPIPSKQFPSEVILYSLGILMQTNYQGYWIPVFTF